MPKCTYCGKEYEFPIGVTMANSVTGKLSYFCSKKCRKYTEMNRKKKKWAKSDKNKEEKKE